VPNEEITTFDVCPVCGSEKRIGEKAIKKFKDDGILPAQAAANLVFPVPMMDQQKLQRAALASLTGTITVNSLNIWWDICEMCGTMYCIKAETVEQQAPIRMQPVAGPPGGVPRNLR